MAKQVQSEPNMFLDHPGVVGTVFAIACVIAFVGMLWATIPAEGHHEHAEGSAAAHAPAASAAPSAAHH